MDEAILKLSSRERAEIAKNVSRLVSVSASVSSRERPSQKARSRAVAIFKEAFGG